MYNARRILLNSLLRLLIEVALIKATRGYLSLGTGAAAMMVPFDHF